MKYFTKIVNGMIKFMIPLVIIALLMGIARVILDLRSIFGKQTLAVAFDLMVTNILSMFVVIELLRSIIEYFTVHRLKITFITDAALVFVLREIMIGLYQHSLEQGMIIALAALILVIGGIRTLAVVFSPEKVQEMELEKHG
ncbi:MAG TPA: phosphate-starvation-inducible PsiE family protein [Nitrospirota bacterium]|nr:phosphate-starvation-inducible PsiE family protein [Nitrospirota bacterium]